MIFDFYLPFLNKDGKLIPGVRPDKKTWVQVLQYLSEQSHIERVNAVRSAEGKERAEAKKAVAAICFTGTTEKYRKAENMTPTGFVMLDVDHCQAPVQAFNAIVERMTPDWCAKNVLLIHRTVGGEGLRIVFKAQEGYNTLLENMNWFAETAEVTKWGDYDGCVQDFSRLSFLCLTDDLFYQNDVLLEEELPDDWKVDWLTNDTYTTAGEKKKDELFGEDETVDNFTDEEVASFDSYEYKGTLVKTIIAKWVELYGQPGRGEIHNYYNDMVKNFRNIVSNDKRALLYLLPRFGHSASECWSSIVSICKVNTLSTLPKPFYFFLKENGFYKSNHTGSLAAYMMSDEPEEKDAQLPWLPPVFREFVRIAPKDFRTSMVNALLPVMGTLTSYLQAPYYFDGRMHTTSFFSVIYAPPGTGKGFVERIIGLLFEQVRIRDYVQNARNEIYNNTLSRKGDNERSPEDPHTSLRIIPPKNSEAEFLSKQRDNHGYHMFTFAAEMDSWAKGVKAGGGNKDDMIRIAWDNGEYGQQFKSATTFKGSVNLYWNVLITGTLQQLMLYFKNVENGLVTRCSFTTIDNQEFAAAPVWKSLTKKEEKAIQAFADRCDRNTYMEPCTLLPEDVDCVSADKFDEEINWRFTFKKRKTVSMEWLKPAIINFLETQLKKAALDLDKARDVFRRRAAVRGFRLGLICMALWERPTENNLKKCIPFIEWWMEQDLESSLKLWGARYNTEVEEAPNLYNRSLYAELRPAFTKNDVYALCVKQGIKSPVRQVIYNWIKLGYVEKTGKDEYQKKQKA